MTPIQTDTLEHVITDTAHDTSNAYNAVINRSSSGATPQLFFYRAKSTESCTNEQVAFSKEVSMNESDRNFLTEELKKRNNKPPWWGYILGCAVLSSFTFTYYTTDKLSDEASRANVRIIEKMSASNEKILNQMHSSSKELLANITASNKELTASISKIQLEITGKEK